MTYFSSDKRINEFCNALIRSKRWTLIQGKNHPALKHISKGGFKILIVSSTPSNNYAYEMMRREYNHYLRAYLIQTGVIIA